MKNRVFKIAATLACFSTPLWAACPDPVNIRDDITALFDKARAAQTHMEGRAVSAQMWEVLLQAPDEAAQELLDDGMKRRGSYDFAGAIGAYDRLTEYCPTYAEGYNQRAFIHFLQQEYETALVDLDAALSLQPLHIGAQSGRALTLMNLGRLEEAREQLLEAVENNPWLSERALLADGAPLGPVGREL